MRRSNTAEGGTNGTSVTTGNSGGLSGAKFDNTTVPAGGSLTYDTTAAVTGSLGFTHAIGATAGECYYEWTASLGGSFAALTAGASFTVAANPGTAHKLLTFLASGTAAARVVLNTAGTISITNSAGSTVATSANTVPLNQGFRVELDVTIGAGTGRLAARLYALAADTVPLETLGPLTGQNAGAGLLTTVRYGPTGTTVASVTLKSDDPFVTDGADSSWASAQPWQFSPFEAPGEPFTPWPPWPETAPAAPAAAPAGAVTFTLPPARRGPHRASLGARGALAAGILAAGIGPPAVPAPHQPPTIAHLAPHRAQWRGGAGPAPVAVQGGAPQPFKPVTVYARKPHGGTWRSGQGAPPSARPQPFRPVAVYTRPAHRAAWRAITGAAPAVAPSLGAAQPFRPLTVFARRPHGAVWKAVTGRPPAPPAQPFKPVTVHRRKLHGAAWRAVTGRPPAGTRQPRTPATVFARLAHRALWRAGAGSPPPPPPPFTVGTLTAATAPAAALTGTDTATAALGASTAAPGALTAGTSSTGGPS